MIVSHKHKYIFIGLPCSGSSAISKELIENYEGEYVLSKHTNIQTFINQYPESIKGYTIFAVYRNLEDILFSRYNKFKYNHKETYTNPTFRIENGGFVSNKSVAMYNQIQTENLDFEKFIILISKNMPYDFPFSMNAPYLTHIIHFENLNEGFQDVIEAIGIKLKRPLPIYNKTKSKDSKPPISDKICEKFLNPYNNHISKFVSHTQKYDSTFFNKVVFEVIHLIRIRKWLKDDLVRNSSKDGFFGKFSSTKVSSLVTTVLFDFQSIFSETVFSEILF
jgi:hypothetical protein